MPESPNKLLNNDHGNYVYATYTGHIFDTTLDIYFAEARFYDANTRTWLAMDPIKDGDNWYQYCYGNPLKYWDPLGLAAYDPGQPWANRNQPYSSTSSSGRFTTYGGCDSAMPWGMRYSQAQAAGLSIDVGALIADPRFQAAMKVIGGAGQAIAGIALITAVVTGTGGFGIVGMVIFGTAGATSTVFGINDAVEGVLDAHDIYQNGNVLGDNNYLRRNLPDGVYYAVDITSEVVTGLGLGIATKNAHKPVEVKSGSSSNTGVGNPAKIEGRGSTGRTVPNNLEEQMAMHQVQSNPLEGASELPIKLNDTRWKSSDGWVKMQSVVKTADGNKITIHYVYNKVTGAFDDFKFK